VRIPLLTGNGTATSAKLRCCCGWSELQWPLTSHFVIATPDAAPAGDSVAVNMGVGVCVGVCGAGGGAPAPTLDLPLSARANKTFPFFIVHIIRLSFGSTKKQLREFFCRSYTKDTQARMTRLKRLSCLGKRQSYESLKKPTSVHSASPLERGQTGPKCCGALSMAGAQR
jgi:hypothetical protein